MEIKLDGADSRRGVARDKPVMVRFGSREHGKVYAAAQKIALDFATYVRCAALTMADAAGAVAAEPEDTRQLPLPMGAQIAAALRATADAALVAKPRKARSAEAPATPRKVTVRKVPKVRPKKPTPTPKKQSGKRGGK